jgi:hypothetical protein
MAFSRLKKKEDADRELTIFKSLEEERKQRKVDDNSCQADVVTGTPSVP